MMIDSGAPYVRGTAVVKTRTSTLMVGDAVLTDGKGRPATRKSDGVWAVVSWVDVADGRRMGLVFEGDSTVRFYAMVQTWWTPATPA